MIKLVNECHKQISSRVCLAVSFIDVLALAPFAAWPSTIDCTRIEGFFHFFNGNSMLTFDLVNDFWPPDERFDVHSAIPKKT